MQVIAISDIHSKHRDLKIPDRKIIILFDVCIVMSTFKMKMNIDQFCILV